MELKICFLIFYLIIKTASIFLEKNNNYIDWNALSKNPNAIHLLKKNYDKINWNGLSLNINAIHILKKYRTYKLV